MSADKFDVEGFILVGGASSRMGSDKSQLKFEGQAGVERIIYTDVARDGMLVGPNVEQTRLLARESGLKVTASGGVSSLADLERLKHLAPLGVDGVIVGKALYERRFTFAEAARALL